MSLNNLKLQSAQGSVALESLWRDKPLLLVLLRHTGCPVCREHLLVTEGMLEDIEAAGCQVIGVSQGSGQAAADLAADLELSFPVLGDPDNALYRELAMTRGSLWQVTLLPLLRQPLKGLARMRHVKAPGRDVRQLGGVVLLNTKGEVGYRFCQRDSGEIPEEDEVMNAVKTVLN